MTRVPPTIPPLIAPEFLATTAADVPLLEVTDRIRMIAGGGVELRWVHRAKGPKLEGSRRAVQMAEFAVLLEMATRIHPDYPEPTVASFDTELGVVAAMQWALGDRAHLVEVTPVTWNSLHGATGDLVDDVEDSTFMSDALEAPEELGATELPFDQSASPDDK